MINSANPYALLDDSVGEAVVAVPKTTQPPAKAAAPAKPASTNANANSRPATIKSNGSTPAGSSNVAVPHKDDSARREGSRPRRGARGGYSGNGRQFDRHSGTHRDTDKKVNQGWGNGADATSGENAEGEVNAEETTADVSPVEKAEPEEVIKTLDEYLAEKAAATKITRALPEARKPDQSKWSQSKPLQKEEVGDFFSVAKEKSKKSAVAKPAATKQQVDIQQTFTNKPVATDSYRDSNRGGGRGGKNKGTQQMRGAPRQSRANAPNVNDSNAFPVLA